MKSLWGWREKMRKVKWLTNDMDDQGSGIEKIWEKFEKSHSISIVQKLAFFCDLEKKRKRKRKRIMKKKLKNEANKINKQTYWLDAMVMKKLLEWNR